MNSRPVLCGVLLAAAWMVAGSLPAGAGDDSGAAATSERSRWNDTGRFYLYAQVGQTFMLREEFVGDVDIVSPDGLNLMLGGGVGYNFTDHWGLELDVQGTEPDLVSDSLGKVDEFSIFSFIPRARFRWPLGDGRFVPFANAGVGVVVTDINEGADPLVRMKTDEVVVAGGLGLGFDYFVAPNVAFGLGLQSVICPDQSTTLEVFNRRGGVSRTTADSNLTNLSVLGHVRVFPGQAADGTHDGHWLLADHGPYDSDEVRGYLSGMFGFGTGFDNSFGGGIELDRNAAATVGGALGANFDRYWGVEVQLLSLDVALDQSPNGKVAEFGVFSWIPTVRFRYPFLEGRLVPFVTAGLGGVQGDVNDQHRYFDSGKATPIVDVGGPALAGSVGLGLEYFLNHNISVGVAVPFVFAADLDTTATEVNGKVTHGHVNVSGVNALFRLTAYVP